METRAAGHAIEMDIPIVTLGDAECFALTAVSGDILAASSTTSPAPFCVPVAVSGARVIFDVRASGFARGSCERTTVRIGELSGEPAARIVPGCVVVRCPPATPVDPDPPADPDLPASPAPTP